MSSHARLVLFLFLIAAGFGLSACETMKGAGRDIESAGENVQDAAD